MKKNRNTPLHLLKTTLLSLGLWAGILFFFGCFLRGLLARAIRTQPAVHRRRKSPKNLAALSAERGQDSRRARGLPPSGPHPAGNK